MEKKTKKKIINLFNKVWNDLAEYRRKPLTNLLKYGFFMFSLIIIKVLMEVDIGEGNLPFLFKIFFLFYIGKFILLDLRFDGIFNVGYIFGLMFLITNIPELFSIGTTIIIVFVVIDLLMEFIKGNKEPFTKKRQPISFEGKSPGKRKQ